eukprot:TRINITY_DN23168_c0_g1_i1.p2 TRINITY_DN23168_c0_g1~~TRINITY_DN23168_c0_g1_i1.p2  ORF type:complete len:223 (-),score=-15.58 TRINITY_DN23168_c0_g1_i1:898-1566(-)
MGVNRTVDAVEDLLLHSLGIELLASLFLGYIIARSLTRPLADISNAACRVFLTGETSTAGLKSQATMKQAIWAQPLVIWQKHQHILIRTAEDFWQMSLMSQRLQSPVSGLQLRQQLTEWIVSPDQQKNYLTTIISESKRINRLIHDQLDLAQLNAGELFINSQPLNPAAFLLEQKENIFRSLQKNNFSLSLSYLPASPRSQQTLTVCPKSSQTCKQRCQVCF